MIIVAFLGACDQDPLGCAIGKLPGGYGLQQWEDEQAYYLLGPNEKPGGGVLEGTVVEIGWNDHFIVARRRANFGGDPDGWMIVNVDSKTVHGPVHPNELEVRPALAGIVVRPVRTAWESLTKCRSPILTNR